jgi:hypothetical protein
VPLLLHLDDDELLRLRGDQKERISEGMEGELDGLIDTRWRSRNIGFTPFSMPSRADHMKIAVELEHNFPPEREGPLKVFRWVLTMDLDCFRGQCSTVGFMGFIRRMLRAVLRSPWRGKAGPCRRPSC